MQLFNSLTLRCLAAPQLLDSLLKPTYLLSHLLILCTHFIQLSFHFNCYLLEAVPLFRSLFYNLGQTNYIFVILGNLFFFGIYYCLLLNYFIIFINELFLFKLQFLKQLWKFLFLNSLFYWLFCLVYLLSHHSHKLLVLAYLPHQVLAFVLTLLQECKQHVDFIHDWSFRILHISLIGGDLWNKFFDFSRLFWIHLLIFANFGS